MFCIQEKLEEKNNINVKELFPEGNSFILANGVYVTF